MEDSEIRLECLKLAVPWGIRKSEFDIDKLLDISDKLYQHVKKKPTLLEKVTGKNK